LISNRAAFTAGTVVFRDAEFSEGTVDFTARRFLGGTAHFTGASGPPPSGLLRWPMSGGPDGLIVPEAWLSSAS
jgi:hypothetical protein